MDGHATTYLRIALLGTTPLLVMLAATGVLRGLQDTRTPLVVAVAGNGVNVGLNLVLVYGVGPSTDSASPARRSAPCSPSSLSAAALLAVVVRGARRAGASLRPDLPGIRAAAHAGRRPGGADAHPARGAAGHDVRRDAGRRGAAGQAVDLATHQLALTLWTFLAFALDAMAIAAQAITGRFLGAGDVAGTRDVTRRMVQWGVRRRGGVSGASARARQPGAGRALHRGPRRARPAGPGAAGGGARPARRGVVFVLDGVLIGAGDGAYLARGGLLTLLVHAPLVLLVAGLHLGLVAVWVVFTVVFMGARLLVLVHRARGDAWLVTGTRAPVRALPDPV